MNRNEDPCQFHAGGQLEPQTLKRLRETKAPERSSGSEAPDVQWASVFGPLHLPVPGMSWGRRTWETGSSSLIPSYNQCQITALLRNWLLCCKVQ